MTKSTGKKADKPSPNRDLRAETFRRLCVRITEQLEDAHEFASSGQAKGLDRKTMKAIGKKLAAYAADIAAAAETAKLLFRVKRER